jgi:hypothetical protein
MMKHGEGGFGPSYNVQVSTDAANGIIVAVDVTQATNDCDQLVPAVDHVQANMGKLPEQVLVDGGYTMKKANIEEMSKRGIDLIGPVVENTNEGSLKRRGIQPDFYPSQFQYDPSTDTFTCPAGKSLHLRSSYRAEGRIKYTYQASILDCRACPFQNQCCPKNSPRLVTRYQDSAAVEAFKAKMETEQAKQVYRTRAQIAEFPHAWIKEKFQFRRFRLRGLRKVRVEAIWVCMTYNIQQWLRMTKRATLQASA